MAGVDKIYHVIYTLSTWTGVW